MSDLPEIENPSFQQMIMCATDNMYDLTLSHATMKCDIQRLSQNPKCR